MMPWIELILFTDFMRNFITVKTRDFSQLYYEQTPPSWRIFQIIRAITKKKERACTMFLSVKIKLPIDIDCYLYYCPLRGNEVKPLTVG